MPIKKYIYTISTRQNHITYTTYISRYNIYKGMIPTLEVARC